VLCQPCPDPIARASRKWKAAAAVPVLVPKKATKKWKHVKGSSSSGDQNSAQELALTKPLKQSREFSSQSSGVSILEKTSYPNVRTSSGKIQRVGFV
jgi:hypothetical protein